MVWVAGGLVDPAVLARELRCDRAANAAGPGVAGEDEVVQVMHGDRRPWAPTRAGARDGKREGTNVSKETHTA